MNLNEQIDFCKEKRLDTLFLLYQTYAFDMVPTAGLEPATY